jgi:hypothetical protein
MSDVYEELLRFKSENSERLSQEYTQDEIDNHPDSISEFETKNIGIIDNTGLGMGLELDLCVEDNKTGFDINNSNRSNNDQSIRSGSVRSGSVRSGSVRSGSVRSGSGLSQSNQSLAMSQFHNFDIISGNNNSINIVKEFLQINDYFVSMEHYHTKLERPYLIAKKKSQFSSSPVRQTFCYRILTSCLSLHKIIDSIKPYFGLSEYGMLTTKIEHKNKLIRLGILSLSKSVLDAPTRLNSSMYVDMTSLPIEIIMDQYGHKILNCIRSVFAFREIIGFKTPNSGEALNKGGIFFDYKSADDDIERGIQNSPSKYILTFPETLTFASRKQNGNGNDEIYTKRVISPKYVKKFFGNEDNYVKFLKNYVRVLNLDVLKECISKTIQDIDKSYDWLVHYIFKRIQNVK